MRKTSGPSVPFLWSPAWRKLRQVALRRDGFRCVVCGADVSGPNQARVDHIQPRSVRPDLALTLSNIRSLCLTCDGRAHSEKLLPLHKRTGQRIEKIVGCDSSGAPLDKNSHWHAKR